MVKPACSRKHASTAKAAARTSSRPVVESAGEVQAIVAGNRLADALAGDGDASGMLVAVAADAVALRALADLESKVRPPDRWWLGDQAPYLWRPDGALASPGASALLGRRGDVPTTRHWATFVEIAALFGGGDAAPLSGGKRA